MAKPQTPLATVDVIITVGERIVLIERKNPPHGWALPGGFVEIGESMEAAARREAKEETSLAVELVEQFHTYSDPGRDPRGHTVSTVYLAKAEASPKAASDAGRSGLFSRDALPDTIAFDHRQILADCFLYMDGRSRKEIFALRMK